MTRRTALSLLSVPALAQTGSKARVPRPSPEFVVQMVGGKSVLISQYKGKVVCVEFLLTTCPHCQKASQILEKLYKEFGPRGFQPIGCAINAETPEMAKLLVPSYVQAYNLTFPVGFAKRETVVNYLEHPIMQQLFMPAIAVIDKKWNIRAQHLGSEDFFIEEEKNMRKLIETLLAESGGSAAPRATKKKSS